MRSFNEINKRPTLVKIILAPDKFKGSLSAAQVCEAMVQGIRQSGMRASWEAIPLADGGEGSLSVLSPRLQLERRSLRVSDPLGRPVAAWYGVRGQEAHIEMAHASGLQLLTATERQPTLTSTTGTGELLAHALQRGAKHIYLYVGGSATTDGGMGLVHALGYRFYDAVGQELAPFGESLPKVVRIARPAQQLPAFELTILTDVQNPLYGPQGAAYSYAAQKGADEASIALLDAGLRQLTTVLQTHTKLLLARIPGLGAAGGLPACAVALLQARIQPGLGYILAALQMEEALTGADLVLTGEGKLDAQTLQGKVVHGLARLAAKHRVPVGVICGSTELGPDEAAQLPVRAIYPLKLAGITEADCLANAAGLIADRTASLLKATLSNGSS